MENNFLNKKVSVINGKFKGMNGVIKEDCNLLDKWLIQLDEFNAIYVEKKDVKIKNDYEKEVVIYGVKCNISIEGNNITVNRKSIGILNVNDETAMKVFKIGDKALSILHELLLQKIFLNKEMIMYYENQIMQGGYKFKGVGGTCFNVKTFSDEEKRNKYQEILKLLREERALFKMELGLITESREEQKCSIIQNQEEKKDNHKLPTIQEMNTTIPKEIKVCINGELRNISIPKKDEKSFMQEVEELTNRVHKYGVIFVD